MKIAARHNFTKKRQEQKREYISEVTWNLMEERQAARLQSNAEDEKKLSREISKQAKKDKQQFRTQRLENLTGKREC